MNIFGVDQDADPATRGVSGSMSIQDHPRPDVKTLLHQILHNMSLHPPSDPKVIEAFEILRDQFKEVAACVACLVPSGRERSQAITALEDALQYAIGGIARNQEGAIELIEIMEAMDD